jgi:5-methylcytosine-specific restriction endonuclease McrA
MRRRSWTDAELTHATKHSHSVREVIRKLKLVPAGGNYTQIIERMRALKVSVSHFTGKGWRQGSTKPTVPERPLTSILTKNSSFQSHKLKLRLFKEGLKNCKCEMCGWSKTAPDGRIPLELDHINGIHSDNRLSNLRILCPNCHSLQSTHRGKNKGRSAQARVA